MYTYKLHTSNATPVLSSRAHLGRISGLPRSHRGEGGEGGEGEGGRGGGLILVFPSHRQPKLIGGGETSPPDFGAHLWVHTAGPPPPPRW